MMDGITDMLKVIGSSAFKDGFMPDSNGNGTITQSRKQKGEYIKNFRKQVKDGEILRYSMHTQMTTLACYKGFDDYINNCRREEVDRLNEKYYGKEKYLKIKQCM